MQLTMNDTVEKQNQYASRLQHFDIIAGEAFVNGMRDIGYKDNGSAINELIDNSIEAGAENVVVHFGYGSKSTAKPEMLAIIDDGHGMSQEMIRAAALWGGGHRTESRELFGRYGFGLPSSCVSIGRRFEVYSKLDGGEWHMTYVDLDEIAEGRFHKEEGRLAIPPAENADLPVWVNKGILHHFPMGLSHGTVIIIETLDRLNKTTTSALEPLLMEKFGLIYRNFLREVNIFVNGKKVDPVDPLFLDESARFYDENSIHAEGLEPVQIEVKDKDTGKFLGTVKVRYSYMPPGFQNVDGKIGKSATQNKRFNVMKDNNGILALRAGRQIDVVTSKIPKEWNLTFANYDRNWKVELDFSPSLDEEFQITTSKQQVVLSDRMWSQLEQHGVKRAITALRIRFHGDLAKAGADQENEEQQNRTSESAMVDAAKFKTRRSQESPEQKAIREEALRREIESRVKKTGKSREVIKHEITSEVNSSPYKLSLERSPEGPFYRVEGLGSQVHVFLNEAHPFFNDVYQGPDSTPRLRAALECLLFVMSECELDANEERQEFYKGERREWSQRFSSVLKVLDRKDPVADAASFKTEMDEVEQGEKVLFPA